jgi:predicted ATP-grasp superfamily ATP-dependent carboligase
MSNIEIVEIAEIPVKKRTVVTGFAGAGFVSNTALMYIARSKGFKLVGHLHSNLMPALMILVEGKPRHSFRIYTDASDDIMFLVTESLLSTEPAWTIGQELMAWLKKKGLKEILTFEGFPFSQKDIFGYTTGDKVLQNYGIQPIAEGAVSGVNAVLMDESMKEGVDLTTVFIPTRSINSIDYHGVLDTIQVLNTMFKLDVDTTELSRMAENMDKAAAQQRPPQQQRRGGFLGRILPGESDA